MVLASSEHQRTMEVVNVTTKAAGMERMTLRGRQEYEPMPVVRQGRCVGYAAICWGIGGIQYLSPNGEHIGSAETPLYVYPTADDADITIAAWQTQYMGNVAASRETPPE